MESLWRNCPVFASDRQRPDERLTDDCGGKTRVDGSSLTTGPTGRQASRARHRLGAGHFTAGFIAATRMLLAACVL